MNLYTYVGNNPLTFTDPTGHKWYHKLSGFLDALANTITFGGYDYVVHKVDDAMGWTQEEPDYFAAQSWGYSVAETGSAFLAALGATGTGVGGGGCLVTAGGGCVVAVGSAGVMVLAGFEGSFAAEMNDKSSDLYQYYKSNGKPYSDPTNRPKYGNGQVDEVWENAKDADGRVYDPNTGEELFWDTTKSRAGQWDMGHIPDYKYSEWHKKYILQLLVGILILQSFF
ncbi:hypothetical protein ASG89_33440 [Paenibacillus sp. Soil766]|uniref:GH-E family nuclease n=1 Tax=Paenibacillus sp. Soil766 TaxID=1736404 RepID=UPI00070B4B03|nr:GH-E family nuclease [Paenibacillus sp. Soil766]KRE92157.1 hypothetical protein ASG89_33440 [Paenibacillus sp. Soil766]